MYYTYICVHVYICMYVYIYVCTDCTQKKTEDVLFLISVNFIFLYIIIMRIHYAFFFFNLMVE